MEVCVILAVVIFGVYVCSFMAIYKQVPCSISETYYVLKYKAFLPLTLTSCGVLLFIPWVEVSNGSEGFAFLSVTSLLFVAASPAFKESLTKQVHYTAASIMFASTIAWELINGGTWTFLVIFSLVALTIRDKFMFLLEIGLMCEIALTLSKHLST